MANPLSFDQGFWTFETTAAVAAGGVIAVLAICQVVLHLRRVRRRKGRTGRQDKVVTRFRNDSPLQVAIAQLANRGEVDTRVAAAESLKELARQSPQDYWSVMETFASHLRRHARVPITRTHAAANSQVTKLAPDIQAILSVLLHRDAQHESHDAVLDLRNTDLSRADLRGIFLRYADLRGAALIGTALCSANLRDANLRAARRKTNGCHAARDRSLLRQPARRGPAQRGFAECAAAQRQPGELPLLRRPERGAGGNVELTFRQPAGRRRRRGRCDRRAVRQNVFR